MSNAKSAWCLPLITVGISDAAHEALRCGGVPTRDWHDLKPAERDDFWFALYDSGLAVSRRQAAMAADSGLKTIDVRMLARQAPPQTHRKDATSERQRLQRRIQLLAAIKTEIESLGGVWARLADTPYPFTPDSNRETTSGLSGWPPTAAERDAFLLARQQAEFRIHRRRNELHVHCEQRPDDFLLQLEVWRGPGLARVPLTSDRLSLDLSRLPMLTVAAPQLALASGIADDELFVDAGDLKLSA